MKHILIVEDYQIIRLAIKILVQELFPEVSVREVSTFSSLLDEVANQPADLIILDIQIPQGEGFDMIERIRTVQKNAPILIFSALEERLYGIHYLRAGANGFVSKNSGTEELGKAIVDVMETGRYVSPRIRTELLNQLGNNNYEADNPLLNLSQREITIMDMLIEGMWVKEIASRLDVTESSVSTYKARLFEKLDVSTLVEMFQKVRYYKDQD
ncbi:response regulator transcription factor [Dyadobacter sp. MSC1_007]|jgi:two-component system invasion response regulator UvrY|uniref:response regulator transcription factor n=1 Tax=Dyadobacter sp. MSC1_007 TaxID=2909264 RepID=UPI0020301478|nr:response regulator transcription factor [Dyadobacter sp. MSC1_007]